ncbi:uncharacterized protein LOC131927891 [Physella acuta]|uniref:uncharacterized protein LOC131927891 n=1 Tax=Physella acuta TaxID=109671 RepID=UPI0027DBCCA1|nr:uncharacterized protein LOC131927891 [Physella acuta]XP_059139744.1 uncharacterized protein LOC131927891 [Physella acuta]
MSKNVPEEAPQGLTQTKIAEKLLNDIKQYDKSRDIRVPIALSVAIVAGAATLTGVIAVYTMGLLDNYRGGVAAYWLTCAPFCFPVITGVGVAYKRQMSNVGVHMLLLVATIVTGGVGYFFSVDPIYNHRANCTRVSSEVKDCQRDTIVGIYIVTGGLSFAFCCLGVLFTGLACTCAVKRRNIRFNREKEEMERRERLALETKNANKKFTNTILLPPGQPAPSKSSLNLAAMTAPPLAATPLAAPPLAAPPLAAPPLAAPPLATTPAPNTKENPESIVSINSTTRL